VANVEFEFKASISHDKPLIEEHRADPAFAAEYLHVALEAEDEPRVLHLLEVLSKVSDFYRPVLREQVSSITLFHPTAFPCLITLMPVARAIRLKLTAKPA